METGVVGRCSHTYMVIVYCLTGLVTLLYSPRFHSFVHPVVSFPFVRDVGLGREEKAKEVDALHTQELQFL